MNTLRKLAGSPLFWLLVAALALRLGAAVWWESRLPAGKPFEFGDSESYWELGQTIARGEPFAFGDPPRQIFRTPGYPLLLAGGMFLLGEDFTVTGARALGAVLGALTVLGVYALGLKLFDRTTGRVAAALATIYPGAISMSVFVLSEALFCPLMIAQLLASTLAWQCARLRASLGYGVLAGGLAGAATLARPSWLLFTPLAAIATLFWMQKPLAERGMLAVALMVGMIVAMAPWWIRNARVSGHFVPTTLQVGASLYDAWSPQADGSSNMRPVDEFIAAHEAQLPADPMEREYQLDRDLKTAAVDWAKANPAEAARLAVVKLARLWNIWPNESEFRSWPLRLAVLGSYVPVMALALVGAGRFTRRGWPWMLCWLPAAYITLLHMVFVSSIRYREPVMLSLLPLAAALLVSVCCPTKPGGYSSG